jgi:hypothetical protein
VRDAIGALSTVRRHAPADVGDISDVNGSGRGFLPEFLVAPSEAMNAGCGETD